MGYRPLDSLLRHIRRIAPSSGAVQDDGALIERFLVLKDEASFEALLQRHGPMVLGVCRRILRDPFAVEDAFQVTFLVFLRKAHSLRRRDLLANWLYGVAYRTAVKARALTAKRLARETPLLDVANEDSADPLIWRDLRPVLDEEINCLPARYRQPIILCYLEGKTVTEAAQLLGWPAGSVAGRLARAKEQLRRLLTRRGVTLSTALLGTVLSQNARADMPGSLLTATLHAAIASLAGQATGTGVISSSVISLREGVLQAMFVSKLKLTAVVLLSVGILGVGALTYPKLAGQQVDPKPAATSQPPPDKNEQEYPKLAALTKEKAKAILDANLTDSMKVLLMDRFDAARSEMEARWNRYLAGKETLHVILDASLRLLEAERELNGKKADQIVALENQLQRVRELEKISQLKLDAGSNMTQDFCQAKFHRLQAEIWLERAKTP